MCLVGLACYSTLCRIHINFPKLYVDRVASVSAVTVLADGPGLDKSKHFSLVADVDMSGALYVVLSEFHDVLYGSIEKYMYNSGEACF